MNYKLNTRDEAKAASVFSVLKKLWILMRGEKRSLVIALSAVLLNAGLTLLGPYLVGRAINLYIIPKHYHGVLVYSVVLLLMYLIALTANYIQVQTMGRVGQRTLYKIRNDVFEKLEELPIAFFNQNKAGDLISRINNDTDKLNQFFSQSLMQFVGNIFLVIGAGVFLLVINLRLGLATLVPALGLLVLTTLVSPWIKRRNLTSLQSTGGMSAEVQESINNFKVVVAFERRDYFREKFAGANRTNYGAAVKAGLSNVLLAPIYDYASNVAQLIFLMYGIHLIATGALLPGFFISFLSYINRFYDPLRQMASVWSSFQTALAGWDRIAEILHLESDLKILPRRVSGSAGMHVLLEFRNVSFSYPDGGVVLEHVNFALERGKTYALVGPTGGGKTTTASLMARLFDPTEGMVCLDGRDIRTYESAERTKKIGFILQEPFLFTGTVRENITYGNEEYMGLASDELLAELKKRNLERLLERFPNGLETEIRSNASMMSLGQRQLIAFLRALLRKPELLILDEATANIDTVTEELLEEILKRLPAETTRVIIAHRLNTIADADEIFFVNGLAVTPAGSLEHAVEMLLAGKRTS